MRAPISRRSSLIVLAALATVSYQAAARAQSAPATTPTPPANDQAEQPADTPDIVVTAQKRSENIQVVPISISAFSGNSLQASNIAKLADLTRLVPSYRFGDGPGTIGVRNNIRGIGTFGNGSIEPSVATYVDGIYIPRAGSLNAGLLDVKSIEVLSGPQGTLFGRNASVGAISITTATPTDQLEGSVAVEAGTGERVRAEGILNVPISSGALRLAVLGEKFGGYWRHDPDDKRFGGLNTYSARLTGRFNLAPNLTWLLRGDYQRQTGDGWQNISLVPSSITPTILTNYGAALSGRLPPIGIDSNRSPNDFSTANVNDYHWGISSDLTLDISGGYSMRLINAFRHWRADEREGEVSFTPVPLLYRDVNYDSRSQSHELQLSSPKDRLLGGRADFVAGLYYYKEELGINYNYNLRSEWCSTAVARFAPTLLAGCLAGPQNSSFFYNLDQTTYNFAVYSQINVKLTDTLTLTAGGRWSDEKKSGLYTGRRYNPSAVFGVDETSSLRYSDSRFTKRLSLAWRPQPDIMVYSSYSTGFKAGGFNGGQSNAVLGRARVFKPELTNNYEVGVKSQFLNRAVTANLTLFRMDISGFQERARIDLNTVLQNVGDIRGQGAEFMLNVSPTSWLRFNTAVAYVDAKFTDYPDAPALPWLTGTQNLTGTTPTYAPKWATSIGAEVRHDFRGGYRLALKADLNTVSRQNINSVMDNSPRTFQDAYALLSARLTLTAPDNRWSVALFGQNLTDTRYCVNEGYQVLAAQLGAADTPNKTVAVTCFHGNPRTIGLRLGTSF